MDFQKMSTNYKMRAHTFMFSNDF